MSLQRLRQTLNGAAARFVPHCQHDVYAPIKITMTQRPENWVFLGDSLTEGVGSTRVSYVTELATLLREAEKSKLETERRAIHEFRLRQVNEAGFNPFVRFNTAGLLKTDEPSPQPALWLWNLACEGRTIESDLEWLPFLENLQPERIFIFRGSLEHIVRPAPLRDGYWPWWVPKSWRGYAAMDPRCYFSNSWWRRMKQRSIDALKQKARLSLLRCRPGTTLMHTEEWLGHYRTLVSSLQPLAIRIYLLGLLPVDDEKFPGSLGSFRSTDDVLADFAAATGIGFIGWEADFAQRMATTRLFYHDGFHPNQDGTRILAGILDEILKKPVA